MTHATVPNPTLVPRLNAPGLAALSDLQKVFFGYLADFRNPATRNLYEYHLNVYFRWCEQMQVNPLAVDRTMIALYIGHLTDRGLRSSTINTQMTPVKGLYDWAVDQDYLGRNPCNRMKLPEIEYRRKYPLDRDELRSLRRAAREIGGRHWALGELLIVQAMRISECVNARIEDFQSIERGHRVLTYKRKGGGFHTVPLPVQVLLGLEAAAGDRKKGLIITRVDGGPLSRAGAAGLIDTIRHRAGIERKINPHLIRASSVTETVEREDIREGQRLAGHADPKTTSKHYDLSFFDHDTHPSHVLSARLNG